MNLIFLMFIDVSTTLVASKVYMNPEFTLHAVQCSLHFDKLQKNEIHSLNIMYYTYMYHVTKRKIKFGRFSLRINCQIITSELACFIVNPIIDNQCHCFASSLSRIMLFTNIYELHVRVSTLSNDVFQLYYIFSILYGHKNVYLWSCQKARDVLFYKTRGQKEDQRSCIANL